MARWIRGTPYTRFRAISLRDGKVDFVSGAYDGTIAVETLTANRYWEFPDATGEILLTSSTDISTGSILVTDDDSVYDQVVNVIKGTTDIVITTAIPKNSANADSTFAITGVAEDDIIFANLAGTLVGQSTVVVGACMFEPTGNTGYQYVYVQLCNPTTVTISAGTTLRIGYTVFS